MLLAGGGDPDRRLLYLIYDWPRMIAAIDNWVPPARRDTVRALAREIDDTIGGYRAWPKRDLSHPRGVLRRWR